MEENNGGASLRVLDALKRIREQNKHGNQDKPTWRHVDDYSRAYARPNSSPDPDSSLDADQLLASHAEPAPSPVATSPADEPAQRTGTTALQLSPARVRSRQPVIHSSPVFPVPFTGRWAPEPQRAPVALRNCSLPRTPGFQRAPALHRALSARPVPASSRAKPAQHAPLFRQAQSSELAPVLRQAPSMRPAPASQQAPVSRQPLCSPQAPVCERPAKSQPAPVSQGAPMYPRAPIRPAPMSRQASPLFQAPASSQAPLPHVTASQQPRRQECPDATAPAAGRCLRLASLAAPASPAAAGKAPHPHSTGVACQAAPLNTLASPQTHANSRSPVSQDAPASRRTPEAARAWTTDDDTDVEDVDPPCSRTQSLSPPRAGEPARPGQVGGSAGLPHWARVPLESLQRVPFLQQTATFGQGAPPDHELLSLALMFGTAQAHTRRETRSQLLSYTIARAMNKFGISPDEAVRRLTALHEHMLDMAEHPADAEPPHMLGADYAAFPQGMAPGEPPMHQRDMRPATDNGAPPQHARQDASAGGSREVSPEGRPSLSVPEVALRLLLLAAHGGVRPPPPALQGASSYGSPRSMGPAGAEEESPRARSQGVVLSKNGPPQVVPQDASGECSRGMAPAIEAVTPVPPAVGDASSDVHMRPAVDGGRHPPHDDAPARQAVPVNAKVQAAADYVLQSLREDVARLPRTGGSSSSLSRDAVSTESEQGRPSPSAARAASLNLPFAASREAAPFQPQQRATSPEIEYATSTESGDARRALLALCDAPADFPRKAIADADKSQPPTPADVRSLSGGSEQDGPVLLDTGAGSPKARAAVRTVPEEAPPEQREASEPSASSQCRAVAKARPRRVGQRKKRARFDSEDFEYVPLQAADAVSDDVLFAAEIMMAMKHDSMPTQLEGRTQSDGTRAPVGDGKSPWQDATACALRAVMVPESGSAPPTDEMRVAPVKKKRILSIVRHGKTPDSQPSDDERPHSSPRAPSSRAATARINRSARRGPAHPPRVPSKRPLVCLPTRAAKKKAAPTAESELEGDPAFPGEGSPSFAWLAGLGVAAGGSTPAATPMGMPLTWAHAYTPHSPMHFSGSAALPPDAAAAGPSRPPPVSNAGAVPGQPPPVYPALTPHYPQGMMIVPNWWINMQIDGCDPAERSKPVRSPRKRLNVASKKRDPMQDECPEYDVPFAARATRGQELRATGVEGLVKDLNGNSLLGHVVTLDGVSRFVFGHDEDLIS